MKIRKLFAFLTISALLTLSLTAAALGGLSDRDFVNLCRWATDQEIRNALLKGANPNAKDDDGFTALMRAAEGNTPEAVSILLKAGVDVNAKHFPFGGTALMRAAMSNKNSKVISILLNAGADVNAKDKDGGTALMLAVMNNTNSEVTSLLLKAGADVNATCETSLDVGNYNLNGMTVLMCAALASKLHDNSKVISLLLDAGANVNAKSRQGMTALMYAAAEAVNPKIINLLVKAGVDVNAKDNSGRTARDFAVSNGKQEAAAFLATVEAELNAKNADTGDPEAQYQMGLKYATGDGVKADDKKAVELFRKAAAMGHQKAKEALKLFGEEVPTTAKQEQPKPKSVPMSDEEVFIALCKSGTVQELTGAIKAGSNVNATDRYGQTALMAAAESNENPEAITALLDAGAEVNAKAGNGRTALMFAAQYSNSLEVVTALLNAGANVNAEDNYGGMALMFAAQFNKNPEIITALLNAGAKVTLKARDGKTALDYAREYGNTAAVRVLGVEKQPVVNQKKAETVSKTMSDEEYLEMKKVSSAFAKADKELNQVWKKAKKTLGKSAFSKLEKEQREWISKGRDAKANQYIDEGMSRMEAYTAATEDRVYEMSEIVNGWEPNAKDMGGDVANASIAGDKVNVRSKPNTSSRVVKQLNTGHPVTIIRQDGDWYLIQTASGTEGWVFWKYVKH